MVQFHKTLQTCQTACLEYTKSGGIAHTRFHKAGPQARSSKVPELADSLSPTYSYLCWLWHCHLTDSAHERQQMHTGQLFVAEVNQLKK